MSWSIKIVAKPEKVVQYLNEQVPKMFGPSQAEYTRALPHLLELVNQNHSPQPILIDLEASGWGDTTGQNAVSVSLKQVGGYKE